MIEKIINLCLYLKVKTLLLMLKIKENNNYVTFDFIF